MKLTVCPAAPTLGSEACPGGFRDVVVSAAQCQHHGSEHKGLTSGQGAAAPVLHPQPQTQAANIWLPAVSHAGGCRRPSPRPQPSTPGTGLPVGIRGAWGRRNPGISAAGANIISWCLQQGQCIPSSCVGSAAPPGAPRSSHHSVTPSPCLWGAMLHSCVSQQITAYSLFFFTLIPRCPVAVPSLLRGLMKFMREVTPYMKKPSLVSDLPWEGATPQSPSLSGSEDSGSPQHHGARDHKVIPLKMCFAARNLSMPDLENRLIELHSPDSRNTLILRCKDTATAHSWFTALHANITALLPQVLAELNAALGGSAGGREVKHVAWLAEQARLDGGRQQWRPVLMAVTEKDLLLYDAMPWTRDAWASPCHSYPLVATRLVHSGSGRRSPSLGSELTFATRTGSRQGIEMHVFRVETHRDLSCWTRVLVQGCHAAAELIKEVSVGCTLGGQEVKLCIHYEGGFTICRDEAGGSVLYRYPYEKLKMSADDGIRTLYLDFGGPEGELALDLHSCPKPIVFVLHTFLSAKVTRMGLLV
uniref:Syntrophin beta 2 n=1 Tax=Chrysolophus pictus TaxID=9089 RepID=A0A8C3Q2W4_CHRPC